MNFKLKAYMEYLHLLGIDHVPVHLLRTAPYGDEMTRVDKVHSKDEELRELQEFIGNCTRCKLCEGRKNIVFGVGNFEASVMFIGEGPGVEEDLKGEPFVGAAGRRLNVWISRLGMERKGVYIANIVKCRPPGNRTPRPDEAATCISFLKRQIEIISPRLIVTLGGPALNYLLGRNERITRVRGMQFVFNKIPLIATFHPAYILRNPAKEKEVYFDLDAIKEFLKKGHGG